MKRPLRVAVLDLVTKAPNPRLYGRGLTSRRPDLAVRWMDALLALSPEGSVGPPEAIAYFAQESTTLPEFYHAQIRRELGDYDEWLPKGALEHAPNAALDEAGASLLQLA